MYLGATRGHLRMARAHRPRHGLIRLLAKDSPRRSQPASSLRCGLRHLLPIDKSGRSYAVFSEMAAIVNRRARCRPQHVYRLFTGTAQKVWPGLRPTGFVGQIVNLRPIGNRPLRSILPKRRQRIPDATPATPVLPPPTPPRPATQPKPAVLVSAAVNPYSNDFASRPHARAENSRHDPCPDHPRALDQKQPDDPPSLGAHCHPDPNLTRSPHHGESKHTIRTRCGQSRRQNPHQTRKKRQHTLTRQRLVDLHCHRPHHSQPAPEHRYYAQSTAAALSPPAYRPRSVPEDTGSPGRYFASPANTSPPAEPSRRNRNFVSPAIPTT